MKNITISMNEKLWERFKIKCVLNGLTIKQVAEELLGNWAKQEQVGTAEDWKKFEEWNAEKKALIRGENRKKGR